MLEGEAEPHEVYWEAAIALFDNFSVWGAGGHENMTEVFGSCHAVVCAVPESIDLQINHRFFLRKFKDYFEPEGINLNPYWWGVRNSSNLEPRLLGLLFMDLILEDEIEAGLDLNEELHTFREDFLGQES